METFKIEGGRPLSGTVRPEGNKNEALPALMACLLTDDEIRLNRVPRIRDVNTVCDILRELGVEVAWEGEDSLTLCARNVHSFRPSQELCSHVRASILLLGPLLSRFGKVELPLPGGDVIGARRMDTHFEGAETLGASLTFSNPIYGKISKITGTDIYFDEPSVTATENILLLAVRCEGKTVLHNAASEPHVTGLCHLLNAMGARISGLGSNRLEIIGVPVLKGASHTLGPDFMEAGSFLCLGAISGGTMRIEDVCPEDMRFILKTLARIGIHPVVDENSLVIDGRHPIRIRQDLGQRTPSLYSGPWPAFPTDLMSVSIVAATQAAGMVIFHEKMFEGRMFFTDKLMSMGAGIVLCDPHRVVINGPSKLSGARMSSPDVRAGMALLMAALIARGTSEIHNIYQIERGYYNIEKKLESLGAAIRRVPA
ncbi:MAG: UDP-N-acetylglucosamine 1-carboxyvinyltransferase [Deltaproteobacteria bacterium]|nr:UDP-N-acetylglucosamine 1-carboxyvinyltransferase [Deltaproteobacteria bacterium]